MKNYAVCLNTSDDARPDDWWIEFYWAEDTDHAEQQAEDANPGCAVVCVAVSPYAVLGPALGVLREMAERGLLCDLNPTRMVHADNKAWADADRFWVGYLRSADESLRARARRGLGS